MTDAELTAAAERFCAAPLPESVCADLVAIKPMKGRTGTNLLTVAEAKIMLAAALATPPAPNDDLRAAIAAEVGIWPWGSQAREAAERCRQIVLAALLQGKQL